MKLFISVDAEGMPWVPYKDMLSPGDPLYNELRQIMTWVTNTVIDEIARNQQADIVVADSHGSMVNLDPFRLNEQATLVRGFPRPLAMIYGSEGASGALFLGYHGSPQSGGVLGHTYAGRIIHRVRVHASDAASEYLLNTLALGEMGIPVILVAGDESLRPEVEEHTPWAVFVPLKKWASGLADTTPPKTRLEHMIREGVREALRRLAHGQAKPLKPEEPWIIVEYKRPWHGDLASLFPCVERIDGVTVKLNCDSFIRNYKLFEGLAIAMYSLERR